MNVYSRLYALQSCLGYPAAISKVRLNRSTLLSFNLGHLIFQKVLAYLQPLFHDLRLAVVDDVCLQHLTQGRGGNGTEPNALSVPKYRTCQETREDPRFNRPGKYHRYV